jgi:hypothetical protein
MDRFYSPEDCAHILELPIDVMHIIFSKLDFLEKVFAALTCKPWDLILKAGWGNAAHWEVDYNLDQIVYGRSCATTHGGRKSDLASRRSVHIQNSLTSERMHMHLM